MSAECLPLDLVVLGTGLAFGFLVCSGRTVEATTRFCNSSKFFFCKARTPGSWPYVVTDTRNKKLSKSQEDQSDEGDSDPDEVQEPGNSDSPNISD